MNSRSFSTSTRHRFERIERRRSKHLARLEVETCVVERTPHVAFADEPFGERSTIMRAGRADREEFAIDPRQQDGCIADASGNRSFLRTVAKADPG